MNHRKKKEPISYYTHNSHGEVVELETPAPRWVPPPPVIVQTTIDLATTRAR